MQASTAEAGTGNFGGVHSDEIPRFDFQHSIRVTLPPLAMNVYKLEKSEPELNELSGLTELSERELTGKSEPELKEKSEPKLNELSELTELPETEQSVDEVSQEEEGNVIKNELIDEEKVKPDELDESSEEKVVDKKSEKSITDDEMEDKIKEIIKKIKKY